MRALGNRWSSFSTKADALVQRTVPALFAGQRKRSVNMSSARGISR